MTYIVVIPADFEVDDNELLKTGISLQIASGNIAYTKVVIDNAN